MKFVLGTASFDSKYGIANRNSRTSQADYLEILTQAKVLNIGSLDTAPNYGNSESLIGKFHAKNKPFDIYSKISDLSSLSTKNFTNKIRESLDLMKIEKFAGLLFHKSEFLEIKSVKVTNLFIEELLNSGLTAKVGVSVYQESEIERVSEKFPGIELFQVPESVMDRRLLNSKIIRNLFEQGVEFHVRSIFLQGLLLMDTNKQSDSLNQSIIGMRELSRYCEKEEISIIDLCLNYARQIDWASKIVVGVNSCEQLVELVDFRNRELDLSTLPKSFPEEILDPRKWVVK